MTELEVLKLASREIGMLTDYEGWPPSNKGTVKHLQRKGFLVKVRKGFIPRRSMMHITPAGRKRLERLLK